jgi:hypothetical protein
MKTIIEVLIVLGIVGLLLTTQGCSKSYGQESSYSQSFEDARMRHKELTH